MAKTNPRISRRNLLVGAIHAASALALSGCQKVFDDLSRNETLQAILESAEHLNYRVQRSLAGRSKLAQEFSAKDISPKFRPNGNPPPITMDYTADAANEFSNWRLEVSGLVKQPARYSLADLKAMPSRTQITRHDCVEGWSVIGKWKGVRLEEIIKRVQPGPEAKYVVFRCMDTDSDGANYYESIDLIDAVHPQTILAYELNDQRLPIDNGAPLRLRVENQLGYKHAKYIRGLEFVASLKNIGRGKGGYWEDQGYEWYAGI
ncbi:MAG TPA: molybdopterin-binding protein [Candidatus Binatia bacterium]|nr:molybdopterin-binding protein [Candidatus Binatia bacterium]